MMKKFLNRCAQFIWYDDVFVATWLTVFTMLYIDAIKFRRFLYRKNILKTTAVPCPVIIVGNITVGGTGKTPLVIALANYLKQQGFRPGIISRGYGGNHDHEVLQVTADSDPWQTGDETILIARQTGSPVAVAAKRVEAAQWLLKNTDCNVILSDDGLQHYALKRDIEIAVVDGERRFGNNNCLPGGPLREPLERLDEVDFIIVNGKVQEAREIPMTIKSDMAINLATDEQKSLNEFKSQSCHALAGIGHPQRFFNLLASYGLTTENHKFPDHHFFTAKEITFSDQKPVLMTEKDAVKCTKFATDKHWYVPITVQLPDDFYSQLLTQLKNNGQKTP